MRAHRFLAALTLVGATALATVAIAAKIDVKTQRDKDFSFAGVRTYAWHPDGAGEFKLLQTTGEDPQALRDRFEPVIKKTVEAMLAAGGLTPATSAPPDLHVYYYVLIGPAQTSQDMGQFIGGITEWGLPPFSGATTSYNAFEQGSLILDVSSPKLKSMVWRAVARSEIDRTRTPAERDKRLAEAVQKMLRGFPPKK